MPWDDLMAVGFGRMRLAPAAFWAMTPREFAAALRPFARHHHAPLGRAGLVALMGSFPDSEG